MALRKITLVGVLMLATMALLVVGVFAVNVRPVGGHQLSVSVGIAALALLVGLDLRKQVE